MSRERIEIEDEILENVSGGMITTGWSNKSNAWVTGLDGSYNYIVKDPDNWAMYCADLAHQLPNEASIIQRALADGKITPR